MFKGKQRISLIAKDLLLNDKRFNYTDNIGYGDLDILHEIFNRSGLTLKNRHPLNVHQAVLNALDRESKQENAIFTKTHFRHHQLCRLFFLKNKI
jgi:hypothetical protein